jgi:hypothetical protein
MEDQPQSALPISYAASNPGDPLSALMRTFGFVAITLAIVRLSASPLALISNFTSAGWYAPNFSSFLRWSWIVSFSVSAALSILLMVAAIRCIRLNTTAPRLILAWAYCSFGYVAIAVTVNTLWVFRFYASRSANAFVVASAVLYGSEQWVNALSLPILATVFFNRRDVKALILRSA